MELNQDVEGMDVYDSDGARVGTIEEVFLPKGDASKLDIVAVAESVAQSLGYSGRKDLPPVFYIKLYEEGFVRVNRGLLRRDAVIFPSQIDDIGEGSVYLNVEHFELTKI